MIRNIKNGLFLFFCFIPMMATAQNADEILSQAASVYRNSNGIAASFALNIRMEGQGEESYEATIQMRDNKFRLQTPDMQIWYDGKTQWVYVERNEEVNITNPSGDELQYTNPMILLDSYQKGFNAGLKGESTTSGGKMAYDIELTPKRKSDMEKIEIQLEKRSFMLSRISIHSKNKMYTSIRIYELKTEQNQHDGFFVFDEKKFPDAEVIDLR